MCWVIPPASPDTTSMSMILSRSDVFPWSTWPRKVTIGGRNCSDSSSTSSSEKSASICSSRETGCLNSISRDSWAARNWAVSSSSIPLMLDIVPISMRDRSTWPAPTPAASENSRTVQGTSKTTASFRGAAVFAALPRRCRRFERKDDRKGVFPPTSSIPGRRLVRLAVRASRVFPNGESSFWAFESPPRLFRPRPLKGRPS